LKFAIDRVKLSEILIAAEKLGYKAEILQDKAYPRCWWEKGCVIIYSKKDKKNDLLRKLAIMIKELRRIK
jgi:Signal recognition particle 19 kDa protein